MSGNATFTTKRSRLAMKTAAETTASTGPVLFCLGALGIVSAFNEPTLVRSVRATAHIRRTGLLDRPWPRSHRRPLDVAGGPRRVPRAEALPGVRGRVGHPEEGAHRPPAAARRRRHLREAPLPGATR